MPPGAPRWPPAACCQVPVRSGLPLGSLGVGIFSNSASGICGPAAAKTATRRLRLQRCHCETEQHAQGGDEPGPDDLLFPHEPNPLLKRWASRWAADQIASLNYRRLPPAFRTLAGTGICTYTCPISVSVVLKSRTTVPLRLSTMVAGHMASILCNSLLKSW